MNLDYKDIDIQTYHATRVGSWSRESPKGVMVTHLPTGTRVNFHEFKSAHKNRASAIKLLEQTLKEG